MRRTAAAAAIAMTVVIAGLAGACNKTDNAAYCKALQTIKADDEVRASNANPSSRSSPGTSPQLPGAIADLKANAPAEIKSALDAAENAGSDQTARIAAMGQWTAYNKTTCGVDYPPPLTPTKTFAPVGSAVPN